MLFERIEVPDLSHYSYIIGCPAAGVVAIVDPERNVERYVHFAQSQGVKITHVLETHIHADYASGAPALAARTGAQLCVSGLDTGELYTASFPHEDLTDGDEIFLGSVKLVARHTPGHTPEHMAYLVYDLSRTAEIPMLMLSGDFLFVGSLGRPDLLGEDEKVALAHKLYASVRSTLADLPDGLEIHPCHGAGSMCGAGMSGRPCSTLGFERFANPYLDDALDENGFVDRILGNVPPFPPYYRRMKTLNSVGAPDIADRPRPRAMSPAEVEAAREGGHVVIDLRNQTAFDGAHIPNALGIGIAGRFATWAAWVVPYDRPIVLVGDDPPSEAMARAALARVGLDEVVGTLEGGIETWREDGLRLVHTEMMTPDALHTARESGRAIHVIDVRADGEWQAGHIPGAQHIMAGVLADRLDELPDSDAPVAVVCGGGYRSVVAASVLERAGWTNVIDVLGGMAAWRRAGLPVVKDPVEVLG